MSATIQTSTFRRIEDLLKTGHTFTQIKTLIEIKAKQMPEGPAKQELRRAWKYVDGYGRDSGPSATAYTMGGRNRADWPAPFVDETNKQAARSSAERVIRTGTFTVVMANGEHRTIRIKKHWDAAEEAKGTLVAQFLSGADNESSYTGMAFISNAGKVIIWKRFRTGFNTLTSALHFLVQSGDYEEAGMRYAMESGRCCKCNRTLTVPASLHRGMGPVCAAGGQD